MGVLDDSMKGRDYVDCDGEWREPRRWESGCVDLLKCLRRGRLPVEIELYLCQGWAKGLNMGIWENSVSWEPG